MLTKIEIIFIRKKYQTIEAKMLKKMSAEIYQRKKTNCDFKAQKLTIIKSLVKILNTVNTWKIRTKPELN